MVPSLVVLSDHDQPPTLPGIATVSKDAGNGGDQGGWHLGMEATKAGRLWLDRPYFTGNPADDWIVNLCRGVTNLGGFLQFGNELDLWYEGWIGGPEAYQAQWDRVTKAYPLGNWVSQPPSGIADLNRWVNYKAKRHAVHAYGSCAEMQARVQWFLDRTSADLFVTEVNFGARKKGEGPIVDVNDWGRRELAPFLAWCTTQPRIKMVAYFAWRWNLSHTLQTPVDAKGTTIPLILQNALRATQEGDSTVGGNGMAQFPLIQKFSPNHDGKRPQTKGVFIHSTRSGIAGRSLQDEYTGTINYFLDPNAQASSHAVIGPAEICMVVQDELIAWHARENGQTHLGIEIAQPTATTPFTEFQYAAAAYLCRKWAKKYGFPLQRVMSQTQPGLIGHEDSEQGKREGKSDPGKMFDWLKFIRLCNQDAPTVDVNIIEQKAWGPAWSAQTFLDSLNTADDHAAAARIRDAVIASKKAHGLS